MTTPYKLNLKKKKVIATFSEFLGITDSDDEKENEDKVGDAGSFCTKHRTPRRDSTILAGNLSSSMLVDKCCAVPGTVHQSSAGVASVRQSRGYQCVPCTSPMNGRSNYGGVSALSVLSSATIITEDMSGNHDDSLVTEDETDFYSCQGSPPPIHINQELQDTWMTDITTKSKVMENIAVAEQISVLILPTPVAVVSTDDGQTVASTDHGQTVASTDYGQTVATTDHGQTVATTDHGQTVDSTDHGQTHQGRNIFRKPSGSTVMAAAFFSVEKRRTLGNNMTRQQEHAVLAGGSDSDSSAEERVNPARLEFTDITMVEPSDEDLSDAEYRIKASADEPLLKLGIDFLSSSKFGKIVEWVQHSPYTGKGGRCGMETFSEVNIDGSGLTSSQQRKKDEQGDTCRSIQEEKGKKDLKKDEIETLNHLNNLRLGDSNKSDCYVRGGLSISTGEHLGQGAEGIEQCNSQGIDGSVGSDSEEDLERFLIDLKTKKKTKVVSSSDSEINFIVPDYQIDSDQSNTPRKNNPRDINTKNNYLDQVTPKNARLPRHISESDSLPDVERKDSSEEEQIKPPVRKPRHVRNVRKTYVIDSDTDDKETNSESGENKELSAAPLVIPPKKIKSKPIIKQPKDSTIKPALTFLSSLTLDTPLDRCHPSAIPYLSNFAKHKTELAKRLYQLYNTQIFSSVLPEDLVISWNVRLTKTAGLCYSKRHRDRHNIEVRSSRIELSTKVLDCGDRLRDTLIHEMCHAASWIISGYRDGHGPLWRTWAEKAMQRFTELPVIDRCHSYQIRTKYTYRCEKCGYSIGRHSKSLDTEKKVCGHCYGKFQLVVNGKTVKSKTSENSAGAEPFKLKAPNAFALFVKENYKLYKQPGVSHGEVMKILSSKFSEAKMMK